MQLLRGALENGRPFYSPPGGQCVRRRGRRFLSLECEPVRGCLLHWTAQHGPGSGPRVQKQEGGEDAESLARRLAAHVPATQQDRQRLIAVTSRVRPAGVPKSAYAADYRHLRYGFHHLRSYGKQHGLGEPGLDKAIPDRRDRVEVLIAEGDEVWMRFTTCGTHQGTLYGVAPTRQRVGVSVVQLLKFADGKWQESWTFADELGFLLQIGRPELLV